MDFLQKHNKYSTVILRVGLGIVFVWSGVSKLIGSESAFGVCSSRVEAASYIYSWAWFPFDPDLVITLQSYFEIVLGVLLIIGLFVQLVSVVSSFLILFFFLIFNINMIWKNIGLLGAAISLSMTGSNVLSLENTYFIKKLREKIPIKKNSP